MSIFNFCRASSSNSPDVPATDPLLAISATSDSIDIEVGHAMASLSVSPEERKVNSIYNQTRPERLELTQESLQRRSLAMICNENSKLKELKITDAEIVDNDLFELAKRLQQLEVIQLINCRKITDAGIRCLACISSLRTIELISIKVRGSFGSAFIEHKKLQNVVLRLCSNLRDEELGALVSLPNLRRLAMQSAPITGKCFTELRKESRLEEVDLFDSPSILDKNIQFLKRCKRLKRLEVCGKGITAMAFKNWGEHELEELILPSCPELLSNIINNDARVPTKAITLRSRQCSTLLLRDYGYPTKVRDFSF